MEFIASVDEVHTILKWIQLQLQPMGLSPEALYHVALAAEEVLVNIIHHAYKGRPEKVKIEVQLRLQRAEVTFIDHGPPFNPLQAKPVNPNLPLQERKEGGLGIHLIRQCVSDLRYERLGNQNAFTLIVRSSRKR